MQKKVNTLIDTLSEFISHRKGLMPILGIIFVVINYILQFFPSFGWVTSSDLFLHFGIILAIFGFLFAWAL